MNSAQTLAACVLAAAAASASISASPSVVANLAPAGAIATAVAAQAGPYWAAVRGDDVNVRSGPSVSSHYSIGTLKAGQPVRVLAVETGWAKVAPVGPAFANFNGYVKGDSSVSYDASTKKLTVLGSSKVFAQNFEAGMDPAKSWRSVGDLRQGDTLNVVEVRTAGADTFYSVRLPASAEVWVSNQFLAALTQAEADALDAQLRGGPAVPPPVVVTPTPTPTPTPPATPPSGLAPAGQTPTPTGAGTGTDAAAQQPSGGTLDGTAVPQVVDPAAEAARREAEERVAREREAMEQAREEARQRAMETQLRLVTYSDLEAIWGKVRNEPTESAELDALRGRYLALASDPVAPSSTRSLASARAEQISMRIEVQQQLLELAEMRSRLNQKTQSVADLELAMWKRKPFDAVGRLNASTVYDGDRLPLLYKLADPSTGHTLAYVLPGPSTKPSEALGLVVGIKGKRQYDETLRVNVISPELIEVLDTSKTAVTNP
jgi:uncharacterized protein YgiM (DUF1202 family)